MTRITVRLSLLIAAASTLACSGNESALDPAGPQAGRINGMTLYMTITSAVVWAAVVIALLISARKGHRRDVPDQSDSVNARMKRPVVAATALTVLILIGTLVYDVSTGQALASLPRDKALRIQITGHQWWWEATYIDPIAGRQVTTANEIHIPVGEPVQIIGSSADVIHSFWIPNLAGKKDLIPGHATATWIQADRPGIYRGRRARSRGPCPPGRRRA